MIDSERIQTTHSTKLSIEQNYLSIDVQQQNATAEDGYQFQYPIRWMRDPSQHKMIGIRKLELRPNEYMLDFDIGWELHNDVQNRSAQRNIKCLAKEDTDVLAGLAEIQKQFNSKNPCTDDGLNYSLKFDIEDSKHIGFWVIENATSTVCNCGFVFAGAWDNFFYFMNQPYDVIIDAFGNETSATNNRLTNAQQIHEFHDVWDRQHLMFHASFSDSPHHFIGKNYDFYPKPSLLFPCCDNTNDFNIYFTIDGQHRVLPIWGIFCVQLAFIVNYSNSITLEN
jgi:hypothetical protein